MFTILLAIAPIFALIVLGHGLRRGGIPSIEFWNQNDRLVYWVLMPALLFYNMSTTTFSSGLIGDYAIVILGGFVAALVFGLLVGSFCQNKASASSVLQGAARHNSFIALAVAEKLYGSDGLALAALAVALLIPVTNLSVVPIMAVMLRKEGDRQIFRAIARDLMRNPLILAVGFGLLVNRLGIGEIPVLHDITKILGGAALPIVLLCVGANIRVRQMATSALPTSLSILGKMLVFPLAIFGLSRWVGLTETQTLVAMLFGAAPTAAAGFTLARQMGGDAPLMAAIITLQTLLAFVSLPLTILWASSLF